MISESTQKQLDGLSIDTKAPLLICDVDDVVVHFLRAFETYIDDRQHYLELTGFALNGAVKHRDSGQAAGAETVSLLVDQFFADRTAHLEPVEGAVAALQGIAGAASVVMLTNLPHHARDKRIENLKKLGLDFPVITNSGPKGPAIKHLSERTSGRAMFIDDSPGFVSSSHQFAPHVAITHFLHDQRLAKHHKPFTFVSLTTDNWHDARRHITDFFR